MWSLQLENLDSVHETWVSAEFLRVKPWTENSCQRKEYSNRKDRSALPLSVEDGKALAKCWILVLSPTLPMNWTSQRLKFPGAGCGLSAVAGELLGWSPGHWPWGLPWSHRVAWRHFSIQPHFRLLGYLRASSNQAERLFLRSLHHLVLIYFLELRIEVTEIHDSFFLKAWKVRLWII